MVEAFARLKFRQRCRRSVAGLVVPGTNVLADVAAEDVVAHGGPQLLWNFASLFNREIGDTQTGIEFARGRDRLCRTCVNAAGTASAAIRRGKVRRKVERGEHHAEKEPGAQLLVDDAGVLADPSDASVARVYPFQDRTGVDIAAGLKREAALFCCLTDCRLHLPEARQQSIMVVLAVPGI